MTGGSSEDETDMTEGGKQEEEKRGNNDDAGESPTRDDEVDEGTGNSTRQVKQSQSVIAEANNSNSISSCSANSSSNAKTGGPSPPRRSKRDTNSIKLRGTATTFYRRMQILFFDESSSEDDYEEVFRSSRASRGRRLRSPTSKSKKRQRSIDESINNESSSSNNNNNARGASSHAAADSSCDGTSSVTGENWLRFMKVLDEAADDSNEWQTLPVGPSTEDYQSWLQHRKEEWQKRRETSSSPSSLPPKPTMQEFAFWLKSRKTEWKRLSLSSSTTSATKRNESGSTVNNSQEDLSKVGSNTNPSSSVIPAKATPLNPEGAALQDSVPPHESELSVVTKSGNIKDDECDNNSKDHDDDKSEYDDGRMTVRRATGPDDAAIFVVDNFLTEGDLLYFDQKIRGKSLRFEKSFVDNMEVVDRVNHNGNEEEENENIADVDEDGANHDDEEGEEKKEENDDGEKKEVDGENEQEEGDAEEEEEASVDETNKGSTRSKGRIVVDTTHRTSTFVSFRKMQDSKIASIEQRIADMFGCFGFQIEALQMVRYSPGQFFGVHHDMGELDDNDVAITPPKTIFVKRRLVTLFIYLNTLDDDQGGATYFPKCNNLRVRPVRGRAVIWSNVTSDGKADSRTIHAGEPVRLPEDLRKSSSTSSSQKRNKDVMDGTFKYGINVWICEE